MLNMLTFYIPLLLRSPQLVEIYKQVDFSSLFPKTEERLKRFLNLEMKK